MLRLPALDFHQPASLAEALVLLGQHGSDARPVSGGTDLLPNLKLGQTRAGHLVSLRRLGELQGIERVGDVLHLGAGVRLAELAEDDDVRAWLPALAYAASRIASPQIRNMATLGGNLCLDTRCRYINQSDLWREALGGCLKSHGSECHVVPGGQGCVAALSSDNVPPLVAYDAQVDIAGPGGLRALDVADLYDTDGLAHVRLQPGEVLTQVRVPIPGPGVRVAYRKWAVRKSIDFPLVSVAVRLETDGAVLLGGKVVVGVLGPKPRILTLEKLAGSALDEALARQLGHMAFARCRPLPNVPYDADYRRERLAIETKRAVLSLLQPAN